MRASDAERQQRADRAGPGLDRTRGGERGELASDRLGGIAPLAGSRLTAGRRLGMDEQVRGAQIAADLGRLRRGERRRSGGQRLEQVLDDVRVRQTLDQLGALQRNRAQVGDRADDLGVLLAERMTGSRTRAQQADALAADRHRRDQHVADGELRPQRSRRRAVAATLERGEQQRRHRQRLRNRHLTRRGREQLQAVAVVVEPVELAHLGAEHPARAVGDQRPELAGVGRGGHLLGEP